MWCVGVIAKPHKGGGGHDTEYGRSATGMKIQKQNFHHRVHNSPPNIPILSRMKQAKSSNPNPLNFTVFFCSVRIYQITVYKLIQC
jgi:hypothetical protein